jgi:hypothetical protein
MVSERASQRAFFGVSALLFAASPAVTIVWCSSMSAMGEMPMLRGWTMSIAWMPMCRQTWPGAAASGFGGPTHFAFENDLHRNLPVESVVDVATIHADEPLAGPKRHQSVGHLGPDGAERNPGPRHPHRAWRKTSATLQWDVWCECRSRRGVLLDRSFLASGLACHHGDRCKSPA